MKIKTKLVISFCMILFIPMLLAGVALRLFSGLQPSVAEENYGTESEAGYSITGTFLMVERITAEDFQRLKDTAEHFPEKLEDEAWLKACNGRLLEKYSYLAVKKGQQFTFNGGKKNDRVLKALPDYRVSHTEERAGTYLNSREHILVKQVDFVTPEGEKASAFIVTGTRQLMPEVKKLYMKLAAVILLILLLTAVLLVAWTYGSIVTPIRKLQDGAENIKEGNLDFSIGVSGEDEIGELGVAFEEMRQRLKENAEEKLDSERENRILVSNIAHDLKTPITALKGYAEGILDGVANTPEKVDKYVRTIYNKAIEMDTLINELTIYAKLDTNRIPYNFTKINVAGYFEDCVEELGLDLEDRHIRLDYDNYLPPDTEIMADPEQLRRVIHNVIGNSVKYMDKSEGYVHIRLKDAGDFVQVEIEDNGSGIAKKDLPYIFDRFYRADASRNSTTGGSGIGLSIVSKIIEGHEGRIWVTSREGEGTTIYFVIKKHIKKEEQP